MGAQAAATGQPVPNDLRMSATLWPVLLASAVSLVPFTVFSTFLVPIARDADTGVATMGSLRGLGGLAALLVGTMLAPFVDRVRKERLAAAALVLLGGSAALGAAGDFVALAAFCLLVGASTAVLTPALMAAAADRYDSEAASGRAATLVTATQSLTAMLAAPVLAFPALLWGWQGDLLAVAVISALLAVLLLGWRRGSAAGSAAGPQRGYLTTFRALGAVPGAVPLLLIAFLRTAAFMGYLAYLAAFYDTRFGLSPEVFAFVWTLSGASFFAGNLLIGRLISVAGARAPAERMLVLGLVAGLAAVLGFYAAPALWVALTMTAVLAVSHATVAACVVTLLVRRCGGMRGSALSINAAGMNLGVFVGAGLGGLGLGLAGYTGTAVVFGALTLGSLLAAVPVLLRRPLGRRRPGATVRVTDAGH